MTCLRTRVRLVQGVRFRLMVRQRLRAAKLVLRLGRIQVLARLTAQLWVREVMRKPTGPVLLFVLSTHSVLARQILALAAVLVTHSRDRRAVKPVRRASISMQP